MREHIRKPKFYRLSSMFMVIALGIVLLGNFIMIMQLVEINLYIDLIAASIAMAFIYMAVNTDDQNIFSHFARGQVFNYLEDFVMIMGPNGDIFDVNLKASQWFSSIGIDLHTHKLQSVIDALVEKGAILSNDSENQKGMDISFSDSGSSIILNLSTYDMTDKNKNKLGTVAIFSNVTQNRTLLERLEKKAGVDYLTGLANRTAYEGAKERLDTAEELPLSIIVCDVNELKTVNDTLGHKYGDMLLQFAASVFEQTAPKSFFVARIGGDEFIFLLPRSCSENAHKFIEKVREAVSKRNNLPFALSVAMGAATKQSPEENLDDVIALADQRMYADKERIKNENFCYIE